MTFGVDDAIAAGLQIINKFVPDPEQREKAAYEMAQLQAQKEAAELTAETQVETAQAGINQTEAGSEDKFVSRWRPFVGWICGVAFAYHFILQPFLLFLLSIDGKKVDLPNFDMGTLSTVLMGLLGLGTLRTVEKFKNFARS